MPELLITKGRGLPLLKYQRKLSVLQNPPPPDCSVAARSVHGGIVPFASRCLVSLFPASAFFHFRQLAAAGESIRAKEEQRGFLQGATSSAVNSFPRPCFSSRCAKQWGEKREVRSCDTCCVSVSLPAFPQYTSPRLHLERSDDDSEVFGVVPHRDIRSPRITGKRNKP